MPNFLKNIFTKISVHFVLLIASLFALLLAYISQYVFGLQPCILCHYQRIIFWLTTVNSLIFLYIKPFKTQIIGQILAIILVVANLGVAGFHSGVERKIFFLGSCSAQNTELEEITDPNLLLSALQQTNAVRCDQPQFKFLGLSMADYNVFYCLFLLFCNVLSILIDLNLFNN